MSSPRIFTDSPSPLVTPAPQAPAIVVPNRGTVSPAHVPAPDLLFAHWSVAEWIGYSALVALIAVLTTIAITSLVWMVHSWRSPAQLEGTRFSVDPLPPRRTFTVLVPARHEEFMLRSTLDQLAQQDHPGFEVIVIVGDDDPGTELAAREAAAQHPDLIGVVIDDNPVKTRPGALNSGLAVAKGEIVGVSNVGDEVHPRLLTLVDSRFSESDAEVVQAGVQLTDFRASWWSLRNVLENYFWFRSGLQLQAQSRSSLLAENSVFITREWLTWLGGWDEKSVAENYELGVRLSSAGAKVVVAYSPEYVTRTPNARGLDSLFSERTRLDLGSLQVLGKAEWWKLPSLRHRLVARYQLIAPFLQSATALLTPIVILVALVFSVPPLIGVIILLPLGVSIVTVAVEVAGLSEFAKLYGQRARVRDYIALILGTFPYQVVLAVAALNAIVTALEKDYSLEPATRTGGRRMPIVAGPQAVRVTR